MRKRKRQPSQKGRSMRENSRRHPRRSMPRERRLPWRRPNRKSRLSQTINKAITHQLYPERRRPRLSLRSPSPSLSLKPTKKRRPLPWPRRSPKTTRQPRSIRHQRSKIQPPPSRPRLRTR